MKSAEQLQKELDDLKDHNADLARQLAKALQAYADEYSRRKNLLNRVQKLEREKVIYIQQ